MNIQPNNIYNTDCIQAIKHIPTQSINCILTDPPYLYLDHKLDRPFDEDTLFAEFKRVLKPNGFIILFGRGTSFYRWNTKLAQLGFNFKEEIVWNKKYISSPITPINRHHETISIHTLGKGIINYTRIPYIEAYKYNPQHIEKSVKQIEKTIGTQKGLNDILTFIKNNPDNKPLNEKITQNPYEGEKKTEIQHHM